MDHRQIASLNIIVCAVLLACSVLPVFLQPTATPILTATASPTETLIPTPFTPTETAVPTPAWPAKPENLLLKYTCNPVYYGTYHRLFSYDVDVLLSWEDKSDNETGFIIYKNKSEIRRVEANVTTTSDYLNLPKTSTDAAIYSVQAFNEVGKSNLIEKSIFYTCP